MKPHWVSRVVLLAFLVACSPATNQSVQVPPGNSPGSSPSPETTSTVTLPPSVINEPTQSTFPITEAPPSFPTATPGAMQLFFPTIIPVMGAAYRPPLYPVPWALSPHDHFYFAAPIAAYFPGEPIWDYRYGGNFFGPDVYHTGIDLPAPRGTDVLAAGPGTVVWAGLGLFSGSSSNLKDPYGKAVAIRHDFGYKDQPLYSVYAHMDEISVQVGQWLDTGDVVGKVGSTGNTTGPHLHFEVRLVANDFFQTRNPELWLASPLGYGVLVGRVMTTYGQLVFLKKITLTSVDTGNIYQAFTYGPLLVNSDEFYKENLVLGDVPAGVYELSIPYYYKNMKTQIQILPGQITYFTFQGFNGYDPSLPAENVSGIP